MVDILWLFKHLLGGLSILTTHYILLQYMTQGSKKSVKKDWKLIEF